MPLLSLSNELLIHIAQCLEYADEVNAYSQTCRLLYSLANPVLFCHAQNRQPEALTHAMYVGDHVLLRRLIEAGISIRVFSDFVQRDPLKVAAGRGHMGNVQVLLELEEHEHDLNRPTLYDSSPIVCALTNGHIDIARLLISHGADPNFAEGPNSFEGFARGRTPLFYAVNEGPVEAVRFLVEEAAVDLDHRDPEGWTPLFFAVSNGFLDAVKLLLSAGADPKIKDNEGKNILFHAGKKSHDQTVSFLLDIPELSDYLLNELDGTAIAYTASEGKGRAADLLLKRIDLNAKIDSLPDHDDLSPFLFSYAACGQEQFVQLLLDKGCDPLAQVLLKNRISYDREIFGGPAFDKLDNPLKKAAANGHTNIVSMLLRSIRAQNHSQLGPSIMDVITIASEKNEPQLLQYMLNSEDAKHLDAAALKPCLSEALFLAAFHEAPTQILLDHGANPDREGDCGFQVVARAIEYAPATLRRLLNATKMDPLTRDLDRRRNPHSLLEIAKRYGDLDMIKLLLEASDDVDFSPSNEECQEFLLDAVDSKHVEIVKYFLDHGFDVNARGMFRNKRLPLLSVATLFMKNNGPDADPVVKLLLDRGAVVNATDDFQCTALSYAVRNSCKATVQTLLDYGADPLHKDCKGRTPVHEAARQYFPTHVRALLRFFEAKNIKGDFMDFIPKTHHNTEDQEGRSLKYIKQHHYRMMYPCP